MILRPGKVIVPSAVIRRLPMYYRYLRAMTEKGVERISSKALSEEMNITSSQLRQDLSYFGEFGQQGYGYKVPELYRVMCDILGIEKQYGTVLVGVGNLGRAIINYDGFSKRGLEVMAVFDNKPLLYGEVVCGMPIKPVSQLYEFLCNNMVDIGIIATPAKSAQDIAEVLIKGGVKGIWNFAPQPVLGNEHVVVENTHFGDGLLKLFYGMKHN